MVGSARSLEHIVGNYVNTLGDKGMYGPRETSQDTRHLASRTGFGLLTAPLWLPIVAIANVINAGASLVCKYKMKALQVVVITVGLCLVPVGFMISKSFGTMYKAAKRGFSGTTDENLVTHGPKKNNWLTFGRGLLGLVTVGIFPAVWKVLKSCCKVPSARMQQNKDIESRTDGRAESLSPIYQLAKNFAKLIKDARRGTLTGGEDLMGTARPIARIAGFRANCEKVVKLFHNAFLAYMKQQGDKKTVEAFKSSNLFTQASTQARIVADGKESMVTAVEDQLIPVAA